MSTTTVTTTRKAHILIRFDEAEPATFTQAHSRRVGHIDRLSLILDLDEMFDADRLRLTVQARALRKDGNIGRNAMNGSWSRPSELDRATQLLVFRTAAETYERLNA